MSFTLGLLCPSHSGGDSTLLGGNQDASGKKKAVVCTCKTLTNHGRLSIWTASEYGLVDLVESIVKQDIAKVKLEDTYGYTALHYAAQHNKVDVVRLLLKFGADVNANKCGATPLHRAATSNAYEACEILLAKGANVNSVDVSFKDLRTPIMKAAANGNVQIVELLLRSGKVDTTLKDTQGLTVQEIARGSVTMWELFGMPANSPLSSREEEIPDIVQMVAEPERMEKSNLQSQKDIEDVHCLSPVGILACAMCGESCLFMQRLSDNRLVCRSCATIVASNKSY